MNLDRNQWFVRLFFWCLGILDEFTEKDRTYHVEAHGTNLCYFIRAMLVWTPLVLLLHVVVLGGAVAILTVIPIWAFGGSKYLWALGAVVTVVALIVGIKSLLNYLSEKNEKKRYSYRVAPPPEPQISEKKTEPIVTQGPGFWTVFWGWLVAQKKRICPSITFTKQAV